MLRFEAAELYPVHDARHIKVPRAAGRRASFLAAFVLLLCVFAASFSFVQARCNPSQDCGELLLCRKREAGIPVSPEGDSLSTLYYRLEKYELRQELKTGSKAVLEVSKSTFARFY